MVDPKHIVKPKFDNFKEEIRNYKDLHYEQYNDTVLPKAQRLLQSNICKSMKANTNGADNYGKLERDSPLNIDGIICMILYCDYTQLSANFTKSFRKSHTFEILESIKRRNSGYFFWSKILRETIDCYGQNRKRGNGLLDKLNGPYFCGMSIELKLPHFDIYLLSPTSTSVQLAVATKFGGNKGMIVELNDPGLHPNNSIRAMNCCWISRFVEEDERYNFLLFDRCGLENWSVHQKIHKHKSQILALYPYKTSLNSNL